MKTFLFLTWAVLTALTSHAQERYAYLPEGKTYFETSTTKLFLRFKAGKMDAHKLLKFIDDSSYRSLHPSYINMIDLQPKWRNADSMKVVIKELKTDSSVQYVTPCLIYKERYLQGLTDKVLVRLKSEIAISDISDRLRQLDIQQVKESPLDREYIFWINSKGNLDALDIANILYESGSFEYCEPDYVVSNAFGTNDPYYNIQWNINNTGQISGSTSGADIKADETWCITKGKGIVVAVLDLGVDLNHPDLVGRLVTGYDEMGLGSNGAPTGDDAHGTACAGIIAANGDNSLGVTGIAPEAKIMPVRIGMYGLIDIVDASAGIRDAVDHGADILSCSWHLSSSSQFFTNSINYALSTGRGTAGCLLFFASANDGVGTIGYPANLPGVICVGGTNMCDQRMDFSGTIPTNSCNYDNRLDYVSLTGGSNYGTGLGVVAPGINIPTTDISGSDGYSDINIVEGWKTPNADYVLNFDGTSSAAPQAAAVMALILSINPELNYAVATTILETNCDKVGGYSYTTYLPNGAWNNEMGFGRINAYSSVLTALNSIHITGQDFFCTGSTAYHIPNLNNLPVTWSVSGATASLSCINCNQTTLSKISTAPVTLTATYDIPCISGSTTSKVVYVGSAPVSVTSAQGGCNFGYQSWTLQAGPAANATNWSWSVDYVPAGSDIYLSGSIGPSTYADVKGGGTVKVTYKDVCNNNGSNGVTIYGTCMSPLMASGLNIFPNPASSQLRVQVASVEGAKAGERSTVRLEKGSTVLTGKIKSIKIMDIQGTTQKVLQYPSGGRDQVTIDIHDLIPGIYLLEVSDGRNAVQQKISIQR